MSLSLARRWVPGAGGLLPLLSLVFVFSGAAGLIYESVWARYLGLFVGHSAYAQILVLTIFLGGMALGALLVGSRSATLRDPLRWYAMAELAAGAIGIVFHDAYRLVTGFAYDAIFPALESTAPLTVAKWVVAGLLILPQSVLLGTTFPLMAAGVLRRFAERPGHVLSVLYFANSLGAAIGVLVAGFYLLSLSGLPGTLLVAAMMNLLAALVAFVAARVYPAREARDSTEHPSTPPGGELAFLTPVQLRRLLLSVSFGTAVASFIYEISWLRMLSLVLGSATHSFELMLSAFILGLALGSLWVRARTDRWTNPLRALGLVQWVMGAAALATLPVYAASFGWMSELIQAFARTDAGYRWFTVARYGLCLAVMLPATFCAGITLPLITRTLVLAGGGEKAIGSVYGVNTLGSILGVMLAGLVLLPAMGLRLLLVSGAALDMALGVVILLVLTRRAAAMRRLAYAALAATLAVTAGMAAGSRLDERILASGIFRHGAVLDPGSRELLFYQDGRTATVSVTRSVPDSTISIATNGKADGSLPGAWLTPCTDSTVRRPLGGDAATQALGPLITLAHAPHARVAGVIGHGTGMSAHFLLGSPAVRTLTTMEIEPEMIRASRAFLPANQRFFGDQRSVSVIEDARAQMAAAGTRYDLIFSEPSNPWVSGVSSLFTTEFYAHVKRHLASGGVFGQWLHLYDMHDGLVLSVLAALHRHFPSYEIFLTDRGDMVVVASNAAALPRPDWTVMALPEIARDLCRVVRFTPQALEATRLTHRAALAPLLDAWPEPNSDFYPILDLGAERARYLGQMAWGFAELPVERVDLTALRFRRPVGPGTEANVPIGTIARVQLLALGAALRDPDALDGLDSAAAPRALAPAAQRQAQWEGILNGGAPRDWRVWLDNFRVIERDRHGGTSGFVDQAWYSSVQRFLDRHHAPAEARNVVAFYRALAGWEFRTAARAADSLAPTVLAGRDWIAPDELLEGGVVAKLLAGDLAGATELHQLLAPKRRRWSGDLRVRLLEAYLAALTPSP